MTIYSIYENLRDNLYPGPQSLEDFNLFLEQNGTSSPDISMSEKIRFERHFASFPFWDVPSGYPVDVDAENYPVGSPLRNYILGTIHRAVSNEDDEQRSLHSYEEHFDSQATAIQLHSSILHGGTFQLEKQEIILDTQKNKTFIIRDENDENSAIGILQQNPNTVRVHRYLASKEMMATVPTSILHQLATEIHSFREDKRKRKAFSAKILNDLGVEVFLCSLALAKVGEEGIKEMCKSMQDEGSREWFANIGITEPDQFKAKIPKQGVKRAWTAVSNLCSHLNYNEPGYTSHSKEEFDLIKRTFQTVATSFDWKAVDVNKLDNYLQTVNLFRNVRVMVVLRGLDEVFAKNAGANGFGAEDIYKFIINNRQIRNTMTSAVATIYSQDTNIKDKDHRFYYPSDGKLSKVNLGEIIGDQIRITMESRGLI